MRFRSGWTVLLALLIGCGSTQPTVPAGVSVAYELEQAYVEAWLAGDESGVLDLFEQSGVIIPSGMVPKQGRTELAEFWFPDDGSTTVITAYETSVDGWRVDGDVVWYWGTGTLSFRWTGADGQTMEATDQRSVYSAIARRQNDGSWLFVHRSWSNLR